MESSELSESESILQSPPPSEVPEAQCEQSGNIHFQTYYQYIQENINDDTIRLGDIDCPLCLETMCLHGISQDLLRFDKIEKFIEKNNHLKFQSRKEQEKNYRSYKLSKLYLLKQLIEWKNKLAKDKKRQNHKKANRGPKQQDKSYLFKNHLDFLKFLLAKKEERHKKANTQEVQYVYRQKAINDYQEYKSKLIAEKFEATHKERYVPLSPHVINPKIYENMKLKLETKRENILNHLKNRDKNIKRTLQLNEEKRKKQRMKNLAKEMYRKLLVAQRNEADEYNKQNLTNKLKNDRKIINKNKKMFNKEYENYFQNINESNAQKQKDLYIIEKHCRKGIDQEVAEAITNDIPNNEKVYLVSDKVINMLNILDKMYDVKRKPKRERVTSSNSVKKNEQGMRCQTGYSDNNNNNTRKYYNTSYNQTFTQNKNDLRSLEDDLKWELEEDNDNEQNEYHQYNNNKQQYNEEKKVSKSTQEFKSSSNKNNNKNMMTSSINEKPMKLPKTKMKDNQEDVEKEIKEKVKLYKEELQKEFVEKLKQERKKEKERKMKLEETYSVIDKANLEHGYGLQRKMTYEALKTEKDEIKSKVEKYERELREKLYEM